MAWKFVSRSIIASLTVVAVLAAPACALRAQADTVHAPIPVAPTGPATDDGADNYTVTTQDAADAGMTVPALQALYNQETAEEITDASAAKAELKAQGITEARAMADADAAVQVLSQSDRDADQTLENETDATDGQDVAVEDSTFTTGTSTGTGAGLNGGTKAVKIITPVPSEPNVTPPRDMRSTQVAPSDPCSGCGGGGGGSSSWPPSYKCIPKTGDYCWHGTKYMVYGRKALAYANSHTSAIDRYPVPFPAASSTGGSLKNKNHTVYVVRYYDRSNNAHTWKFGITSIPNYAVRARVGKAKCNAQTPSPVNGTAWAKPNACHYTWVGVTTGTNGWRYGRYLEASLILWYSRKGGGNVPPRSHQCPPGQRFSCR